MFFKNNKSLLGRTRKLEAQIDEFLDKVNQCGKAFSAAFEIYLEKGVVDDFDKYMSEVQTIEREADDLRRNIEVELYRRTLIPDLRGDVLRLLENIDDLSRHCYPVANSDGFVKSVLAAAVEDVCERLRVGFWICTGKQRPDERRWRDKPAVR